MNNTVGLKRFVKSNYFESFMLLVLVVNSVEVIWSQFTVDPEYTD
jgi:hypothetical protein